MITTSDYLRDACKVKVRRAYVVDAAGFFAGVQNNVYDGLVLTVPEVVSEVKDTLSRAGLRAAMAAGRIKVVKPSEESMRKVNELAKELGEAGRLSVADMKLLALTFEYVEGGFDVIVISDDRSVQNVALRIGAKVLGIKRPELKRMRRYVYVCQACGYVSSEPGRCPKCGSSNLRRVREDRIKFSTHSSSKQ